MSTLIILISSFCLIWLLNTYVFKSLLTLSFVGRAAMAILLLFAGSSHFFKTQEMVQMMPEFLPYRIQLVYFTGLLEMTFAAGLMFPRYSRWNSIALILFFLAILPANIIGSFKRVHLGGMENGPGYLYFRIPLQLLFMGWTYYFGFYLPRKATQKKDNIYSTAR
jgi:uncharacterized membrane protein